MKYRLKLEVMEDPDLIYKCFLSEAGNTERSSISLKKSKDRIVFDIEAKDIIALRATTNSITKLLAIFEKAKSTR